MDEPYEQEEQKTEVIYGTDNILKSTAEITSKIKSTIDNCIDSSASASFVSRDLPMFDNLSLAKSKGIISRFITEITSENIAYCLELMKIVELRHLDKVKLRHLDKVKENFGIIDGKDYRASASLIDGNPPTELIISTTKLFVNQQQSFFDMLWEKAIPAKQRIKEINEGLKREFIETIQDPDEIK